MLGNGRSRNLARLIVLAACGLIFTAKSAMLVLWAQNPQIQAPPGQYPPGQYPPNRPQPVASQCQNALLDQVSADAGRRVTLNLDSQNPYSAANGRQGLRGRFRYGIGGPNSWRAATYDCVVNVGQNRVERATYSPRASSGGSRPGGPGAGGPGVGNYPRVRVDTSGRGSFNSGAAANVRITRGFVDSTGRPVSFAQGQQLHDYVLWSGRALRWQPGIQHADYRLRSGTCTRACGCQAQPRPKRG